MLATKKDKILLKKAREIFGTIVVDAYVCVEMYENEGAEEVRERLKLEKFKDGGKDENSTIEYDGKTIMLVFTNYKAVLFTNSEWASIKASKYVNTEL